MNQWNQWKQEGQKLSVGRGAGGILAAALGMYSGVNALIPLAFAGVAFFVGLRFMPEAEKIWLPPLAVQFGYLCWMLVGAIVLAIMNFTASDVLIDIVILSVGLVWLYARPGLWPVILLVLYHTAGLIMLSTTVAAGGGHNMYPALAVHATLRVLAIGLMLLAYIQQRHARVAAERAGMSSAFE
jgi:hypothetical protein